MPEPGPSGRASGRRRHEPSLRARALGFLARREHSRLELTRKLCRHSESPDEIEAVLDLLEHQGLLSIDRFVASLIHRRAERFGVQRIRHELNQHGLASYGRSAEFSQLEKSEFARAKAVWARRFGQQPRDLAERAKQTRFLAARGFGSETIRLLLGGRWPDEFEP